MRSTVLCVLAILVVALTGCQDQSTAPVVSANGDNVGTLDKGGFDAFGYNRQARIFNGKADGVDKMLDGKVWGDPTYANDNLVMKWNAEWDRGNDENWSKPPYDAWENNEWNGAVKGGSGEVWHYKIIWVGAALEASPYWREGGYGIWGQFEVIMDQGTVVGEGHTWLTHAMPTGYGSH